MGQNTSEREGISEYNESAPDKYLDAARRYSSINVDPGHCWWTTANASEAYPGILAPLAAEFLTASLFGYAFRVTYYNMGILGRKDVFFPEPKDGVGAVIFGRAVCNVDENRRMAHLLPGSSGDDLERVFFGSVRSDIDDGPPLSIWRYPLIALRFLLTIAGIHARMERILSETVERWKRTIQSVETLDLRDTVRMFEWECNQGQEQVAAHGQNVAGVLSPVFLLPLFNLANRLGSQEDVMQLISGIGGLNETLMLDELWKVSQGIRTLDDFLADHGFMGANTGNLVNRNWLEDHSSLEQVIAAYADAGEENRPIRAAESKSRQARALLEKLKSRCSSLDRIKLALAFRLCRHYLPLRETTKTAFFAHAAIGRTLALRAGELLAEADVFDTPEDVLYLQRDELRAMVEQPGDMRPVVEQRKNMGSIYKQLDLPNLFNRADLDRIWGEFAARKTRAAPAADKSASSPETLQGIGVSAGRYGGIARVVTDINEIDNFEQGQILVCKITDPSWAPLFSIAGALVTDIGGMLSHAAIIARELGIPAVVSTRNGTSIIPDGRYITVNGVSGTVEIRASN